MEMRSECPPGDVLLRETLSRYSLHNVVVIMGFFEVSKAYTKSEPNAGCS